MSRSFKDYIGISLKGLAMGAADVIPGVSGGTIAFITGIYEELITSIGNINLGLFKTLKEKGIKPFWEELNGNFLISLAIGIGISLFTLMRLAHYLIESHPIKIWAFFFGLVLASVWFVAKQVTKWRLSTYIIFALGAIIAFGVTQLTPAGGANSNFYFFFAGAIAICAMILPGISGAFILLLLGVYKDASEAVSRLDFEIILIFGLGGITGLLTFSKLLKWLFSNYKNMTLALLGGFILGSLNKIWPWKEVLKTEIIGGKTRIIAERSVLPANFDGENHMIFAIFLFIVGFLTIILLEKIGDKKTN
ncbi:MAG: DUF368 domain-containing protein [Psychroflexus sp.]|uniref:DUF368 domain-containing protein n=1 Tax=Psychroflexus sp. S27 TaxID=1982757 RepID=UPI000C2A1D4F|nr:DUF368 domain-containing protein [Psychroflexus sp. S27]PJX24593.1 DUF368 domain-containing protein [Psychroflexus sp. S27]